MDIDHLIVGAGTAGCVLAARLSEDPARQVMLLEAGPEGVEDAEYDWGLRATVTAGRDDGLARGKVIGGSARVNGMGAVRAPARDYHAWAALGLPAWGWDRVLESYRRVETDLEYGDQPHHGDSGPVPITRHPREQWIAPVSALVEAVRAAGHPYCPDMNAPDASGIGPYPHNRRGGARMPTSVTHLAPARSRPNLTVRADLPVERVVVRDGRAAGVLAGGEFIAAREVILCAGTPLSAVLLLRSGLGPADDLREAGVDVVADLPGVGRNLYDQPGAVIPALPVPGAVPGGSPVTQVIARLAAIPGHEPDDGFYLCLFAGPPPGGTEVMISIMVGDLNPASRGAITLTGPSPGDPPRIDLGFYTAPGDLGRMRAAYRHAWSIAQHEAYARTVDRFYEVSDELVGSDEALDGLLRAMTFSRLALLGGAAMGPPDDPSAVVGEDCRVRGVGGLRVADLSIVPVALRAPTALDAMMIGEHAATLITA
ncbi:GMC family oxidoreductase [Nonomuraea sp. SYSU D8015]|uniref:GMC family oxidoreductase n=1 Tax=Nonomuraea sp. SYSU D8015 TaxID=2593644 RepID=UPI00166025C2|nr:GMC family oxidoreductase N-terminal domain-containing protein [Nonomuraea sp. SYSU D8015]